VTQPKPAPAHRAPYRAGQVGSLLRPERLKQARASFHDEKSIGAEELRAVEDEEIAAAVRMQESVGMPEVTDGEFRRSFWHYDFLGGLEGVELIEQGEGIQFHGATTRALHPVVMDRVRYAGHPMIADYEFLAGAARYSEPKVSIPAPSAAHFRLKLEDLRHANYRDSLEAYFADLTDAFRQSVQGFYDAGCRYIQLDEVYIVYLCDPKIRQDWTDKGIDPDWLIDQYAAMIDGAVKDRPDDMVAAIHLCRGNFRSTFVAAGGYDPAADALFNKMDIDVYFMEYDDERSGGLEPLRLLPRGHKRVMPGFITTKSGDMESVDDIARRIDAAAKFVPLDQLGIAPQCGFASTEEGNDIAMDNQWRKLELVVKVAEKVWGSAL
jgi:5-methyltetrahydropteroyltriglutamate--homocysteine methyltransferase